jgi:4-aminobutyrate aminotransferase-like enzyme
MKNIVQDQLGFSPDAIKELEGYDNKNYRIQTETDSYIFKTYPYSENTLALVEAENEILLSLKQQNQKNIPFPVQFTDGAYVKILGIGGRKTICRCLSFLEGDFLGDVDPNKVMMRSLGTFLAKMDLKLQQCFNCAIKARRWEWDLQHLQLNKKYIQDIPGARDRSTVQYFFQQFEEKVAPLLPELRTSIIHNDANEWNILVRGDEVSGLIDFGDLAYTPLINELAIALTYVCYDKDKPLEWAAPLLQAYHRVQPIEEKEISILYYLMAARLCTSVCNSAHAKKQDPDNDYATVSETSAWNMLYHWLSIGPVAAEKSFRKAVGFPAGEAEPAEQALERRHRHISPILSVSYDEPIQLAGSAFQYMYDAHGNTFLDAYNNIPHVGHAHPKVVAAGQRQMAKLNTNTRYLYDVLPEYAERLLAKFPPPLNKIYFVNSGSAASDLAMRMARFHTGRERLMVMEHGYHGNTQASIEISDYKFNSPKGPGKSDHILKMTIPDSYRGKYTHNDGSAGRKYAGDAIQELDQSEASIAAFISEPILGCAGQVPLADGYLKALYPAVRKQGGICISDEVQTGFGRQGDCFWGFEQQEVVPDMVIIGKPMGNGHPMGAVVTTDEIAASFAEGVEFFSSFGGNPVSCAIGLAVLDVIEEEQLQQNAKATGDHYKSLLEKLAEKHSCIGDVRGSGLFLGIDIVKENTKDPDTELARHIKNELRKKYILISTDGPHNNVLKSKPPIMFTKENAETVVECVDEVLSQIIQWESGIVSNIPSNKWETTNHKY